MQGSSKCVSKWSEESADSYPMFNFRFTRLHHARRVCLQYSPTVIISNFTFQSATEIKCNRPEESFWKSHLKKNLNKRDSFLFSFGVYNSDILKLISQLPKKYHSKGLYLNNLFSVTFNCLILAFPEVETFSKQYD
jgi:hypothetical protein